MDGSNGSKTQATTRLNSNHKHVRVSTLSSIPAILQEYGCDPESIFLEAGFTLAQFEDPDTEINYLAGSKLLSSCISATGCEHFGLLIGMRATASSLGIPGFMLKSAPNLGTALIAFASHHSLQDQGGMPILTRDNKHAFWGYAILNNKVEAINQIYDITIASICSIMRNIFGSSWNPAQVHFSRNQPHTLTPYKRFYKAPLAFNQEQNGILFPAQWLDRPLNTADVHLFKHLEKEAEKYHTKYPDNILGNLRRLILASLSLRDFSVERIASELGMHKRTLYRKLQEEGTSFQHELEAIRYEIAQNLLLHRTTTLNEIAAKLGYSEISAFSRAFKRWSGTTPTQWRANHIMAAK